jgi:hypothetical protein
LAIPKWVWKETAEVLGVVGIIAGIAFLGLELRQNNDLMEAEARFNRLTTVVDAWQFIAEHGDLAELRDQFHNNEALSSAEHRRLLGAVMSVLLLVEWTFREMGENSTELNQVRAVQRRTFADSALSRHIWADRKNSFDPNFVQWMEENVVNYSE